MEQNLNAKSEKFSFDTIQDFDKHILMSIPNYDIMFMSIMQLSNYFKNDKKIIYDIGCSTGNLLRYFQRSNDYKGKMIGIDISRNLLPQNTREFSNIDFIEHDISKPFTFTDACIIYSIFTLQFVDKEYRQEILDRCYDGLKPGGALFLSEKITNPTGLFQDMFTSTYYDYKRENFTEKEIWDKERDLRPMLRPLTLDENMIMLHNAGFHKIEMYYRYFNFVGLLCIK
jgi:tRNA (cmo5U34)-methyltransferase